MNSDLLDLAERNDRAPSKMSEAHHAAVRTRVLEPARRIGADLPIAAVTAPPPELEVRPTPRGTWYLAANADADPVALSNDGLTYAPADIVAFLHGLRRAGVRFDRIYLLHELPGEWRPGAPIPRMRPVQQFDAGARIVAAQEATFRGGYRLLRAVGSAVGAAAATTASVAAAGVQAIALDPIVLGGIHDPDSDLIAWVPLAAWWEAPK